MSAIWTSGQRAMAWVLWWGKAGEHPQHGPHMDPHQAAAVWGPRRANPAYGLGSWAARTLEVLKTLEILSCALSHSIVPKSSEKLPSKRQHGFSGASENHAGWTNRKPPGWANKEMMRDDQARS